MVNRIRVIKQTYREDELNSVDLLATQDSKGTEKLLALVTLEEVNPSGLASTLLGLGRLGIELNLNLSVRVVAVLALVDTSESVGGVVDTVLRKKPSGRLGDED